MTEKEISVLLAELEQRVRACNKRLEKAEKRQDALDKLTTAVEVLAQRQQSVEEVTREIKGDVKSLKEKPGKHWESMIDRVLYLVIGAVFSLLALGNLGG